ncbi:hypothetical protein PUATCC27989T_01472 [Phytobacter ursingii]|nr:hypothetical protein PUATCC27989T_01472 [Phytobacter ursingii]
MPAAPKVSALLHYVPDLHRKMQLATLKQRTEKAARTAGQLPASSTPHRLVPLSNPQYVSPLSCKVPVPATGRTPVFDEPCN